ncbi:MAG: MT-A70 family methyltransferase [Candidatus Pacearchaeota archaeon]|jgi:N6-adenosine-specific RNA methylase IME4
MKNGEIMQVKIHEELEKHIWPLKPEEHKLLEESILADGIRDKLITWQGYIVDGHNRYKIAKKHGLTFETLEKEFDNIEDVKDWMDANQLARRNLTRDQWEITIGRRYNREKKDYGGDRSKWQNLPLEKTETKLAEEYKISPKTVRNYAKIADEFERLREEQPEIAKEIANGEKTIKEVIREVKKEEQKEYFKQLGAYDRPFDGRYDVIVIDPPWDMQKIDREITPEQTGFDYPTMTEEEISAMELPMAEDCHVFMWTTQKFLPAALRIIGVWGLKYTLTFVWDKGGGFQPFGLPQFNCEFCLYARKGTPKFMDTKDFFTCFNADRTGHSKKPDKFYATIKRVTAGRRIDVFGRRKIDGFAGWGNEVGD